VQEDRIVIDSNEDGFSEANIKAICSIGESTKEFSQGYIGEKGIGFKSVFKVARKVHVQSGPFSFAFEYRHGVDKDGLGMVTPVNEERLELPDGIRTRIILHLLEDCDRGKLYREFTNLPDTLLLFLNTLTALKIRIRISGHPEVHNDYEISALGSRVRIDKTMDNLDIATQNYWITRLLATDMPTDNARRNINEAEVVLAFPLDADDVPVIEDQQVFAFFPLRRIGYKVFQLTFLSSI
jgi:hypothetical protein